VKPQDDPMWHEPHDVEGFTQVGTIANGGYKYGTWVTMLNGKSASIQQGQRSKRYWARWGNCYYGDHKTPEQAAKVLLRESTTDTGQAQDTSDSGGGR